MTWRGSTEMTVCHNPRCGSQYLASHIHCDPDWEHSPETHCPYCGQDLKVSAAQNRGVAYDGESKDEG